MSDHNHTLSRPGSTVTVSVGGDVIARSENTILLSEVVRGRKLDPVYYFPQEDVALERLSPTETHTRCPIKGDASYWSYAHGAERLTDLVWAYLDPVEQSREIAGRMAFDTRRVSIEVT